MCLKNLQDIIPWEIKLPGSFCWENVYWCPKWCPTIIFPHQSSTVHRVNTPIMHTRGNFNKTRGAISSNPHVNVKLHSQGVIKLGKPACALHQEWVGLSMWLWSVCVCVCVCILKLYGSGAITCNHISHTGMVSQLLRRPRGRKPTAAEWMVSTLRQLLKEILHQPRHEYHRNMI